MDHPASPGQGAPSSVHQDRAVPVLEIGGTHVTAALVGLHGAGVVPGTAVRTGLDAGAAAAELLGTIAGAALRLGDGHSRTWGIAFPDPFDYRRGIGLFAGMGKFESLHQVDVAAGLRQRLGRHAQSLAFLNDAEAFAIGQHHLGTPAGHRRVVHLTLGTGVGSCFLADGRPVRHGSEVPPEGTVHRLSLDGQRLEHLVSRAAIRRRYADALPRRPSENAWPDVREIAERARAGDRFAAAVIDATCTDLARAVAPWCTRFQATAIVVGGSVSASWDLIAPPLTVGLSRHTAPGRPAPELLRATHPDDAPLIGAAVHARQ